MFFSRADEEEDFRITVLTRECLHDGWLIYRLGGIKLRRAKARPMKLGVSYNLYDGEELLRASIRSIRSEVDFVTVVYQEVSGFKGYFTPENLDYESTDALKRHDVYRDRFLLWVLG